MTEPSAHADTFINDNLPRRGLWPEMDYSVLPELAQSNRIANLLVEDFGLVPGNRVMLRSGNHPMLAAAWYAVLKAGGVAVTTMPTLRAREIEYIAAKAQVQYVVSQHSLAADVEAAAPACANLQQVLYFGEDGEGGLEARAAAKSANFTNVDTAAEDAAIIGFTSGSTGTPKGTIHFHRDLLAAADCFAGHIVGIRPGDLVCGSPQIAFLYGLCAFLVDAPRFGATAVLLERATPELLLETIEKTRATVCFSTPSGYKLMLEHAEEYEPARLRRRRRTAGAGGLQSLEGDHRCCDDQRARHFRAAAHLHLRRRRRHKAGCDRPTDTGLPGTGGQ